MEGTRLRDSNIFKDLLTWWKRRHYFENLYLQAVSPEKRNVIQNVVERVLKQEMLTDQSGKFHVCPSMDHRSIDGVALYIAYLSNEEEMIFVYTKENLRRKNECFAD